MCQDSLNICVKKDRIKEKQSSLEIRNKIEVSQSHHTQRYVSRAFKKCSNSKTRLLFYFCFITTY